MNNSKIIATHQVYEIDEECDRARRAAEQKKKEKAGKEQKRNRGAEPD